MKELIETHFQHEALHVPRFIENAFQSMLSYPNETSKECIQFLIESSTPRHGRESNQKTFMLMSIACICR